MRYRDPTRETAGDARRDLLDAAVVLGAPWGAETWSGCEL
jgi:hypothetical protein